MEVVYKFMVPVDPAKVQILYRWNDGTGAETIVNPASVGDTVFTAIETHVYPPAGNCSYTAEAYIIANGTICTSSSRQEQSFSSWARDNENGGVLQTEPPEALFCEGDSVFVQFRDNSTFNCNIIMEPDKPNRLTRWVQFIYGTNTNAGNRIPNITVIDNSGTIHYMTDASGNSLGTFAGPIIEVPINADFPNQTAFPIYAPPGGVAGDIFEITLRNWNVCNAYDNKPFDGIPPVDIQNGDNPPITTTALVRIITTPPVVSNSEEDLCVNSSVILEVPQAGDVIRWYSDSLRNNLIHTGSTFDPTLPPVNLDNSIAGTYRFYVTDAIGQCESKPSRIDLEIFGMPDPLPNAGPDQIICNNETKLDGNQPNTGIGLWSTTDPATIQTPNDPKTQINNLQFGENRFTWTITNGPCRAADNLIITSDLQPARANAGPNQSLCNVTTFIMDASTPTNSGTGYWDRILGGATLQDNNNPKTRVSGLTQGINRFVWTIQSRYGACLTSSDTMDILVDLSPGKALAGVDYRICDTFNVQMKANNPLNGGTGTWTKLTGGASIANINSYNTQVTGLTEGQNIFVWTVNSKYNVCPISSDTINIILDLPPEPANAGTDQYFCNVTISDLIQANNPTRGTASWLVVGTPGGIMPNIAPSASSNDITISVTPGNEGRYDLVWRIQNGSCISSDSVIIDFGIPPSPSDAGPDKDTCGLEANLNAVSPASGWGTWRQISGAGPAQFATGMNNPKTKVRIQPGSEGIYKFEWRIVSGTCPSNESNIDTVAVVFRPKPVPPVLRDTASCGPASFTLNTDLNRNANVNRWYNAAIGGSMFYEGENFNTPVLNASTTYFISGYNSVSQCESDRLPLNVNIHTIPGIPIAFGASHCGAIDTTLSSILPVNANENRWYADSLGSVFLTKGLTYHTPVLSSTTKYYVAGYDTLTGCQSRKREIAVTINEIPMVPAASDTISCGSARVLLHAKPGQFGTTIQWYDSAYGGNLLENGLQYLTQTLDTTTSFWISSFNDSTGCISPRKEIKVNLSMVPDPPVYTDQSSCGPDTLNFRGTIGNNATTNIWYEDVTGMRAIYSGQNYSPYLTNSRIYWVASYNQATGCRSPLTKVEGEIKTIPNTPQIQGPDIVGLNQSNVVYSVYQTIGSSYFWTIPADVNLTLQKDNVAILEFPSIGTKTISVYEVASNGCRGPERFKDILVKQQVMSVDVNIPDSGWCINSSVKLIADIQGGTPLYEILWTGDIPYLSATDIADPVFFSRYSGTFQYTVSVRDINGNVASDTVIIVVHNLPHTAIAQNDTTICGGASLLISTQTKGGSGFYANYEWTGDINHLSGSNLPHTVFKAYEKGDYRYKFKVTDTNGCSDIDSVKITVASPEAKFLTDAKPSCSPAIFRFQNLSIGGVKYLWSFGDSTTSNLVNTSHQFINTTSGVIYYEVSLKAEDANGCFHSTNQFVQVYPNPDVPIQVSPDTACSPANVLISGTPGGFSYSWTFGDGLSQTGSYNAFHTYTKNPVNDTAYHISLISTSFFGCMDTSYASVVIRPSPKADFTATPESQMFPETTVTLENLTNKGNWTYQWDFGDGVISNTMNPGSHEYIQSGNYTIRLLVSNNHCSDSIERRIKIIPHPPVAEFNPIQPGCMPLTVHFQNYSSYSDTYLWDFGDGSVSNKPNPVYTFYEPGNYTVKLTVTGPGGTDTKSREANIYVVPHSFFDIAPKFTYVNDQPANFFNMSENGTRFLWDFGDGTTSEEQNPAHVYTAPGIYNVQLKVWTENNCLDVYTKENAVVVEESGKVEYPNVFSPFAGLQENKIFLPAVIDNVIEYHLMIFNRWGEMVFESYNKDIGWDGTYKGKPAKQDVYMYKVVGKYSSGRSFIKTGDVTLLY
jgi:gliding motility-associated-like protein